MICSGDTPPFTGSASSSDDMHTSSAHSWHKAVVGEKCKEIAYKTDFVCIYINLPAFSHIYLCPYACLNPYFPGSLYTYLSIRFCHLFIYRPVYLSIYLYLNIYKYRFLSLHFFLSIYLSISIFLSICLSTYPPISRPICLSISIHFPVHPSTHIYPYLSLPISFLTHITIYK